jgi:hypothetical protein
MNSIYSAANPCSLALDGSVATFMHNNCNLYTDGLGGWLQVDLGAVRAINLVKVVCRQDAANVNRECHRPNPNPTLTPRPRTPQTHPNP